MASGNADAQQGANPITDAVSQATNAASNLTSSASGLQGLSGGLSAIAAKAGASIPGASALSGAINNVSSGLMNNITSSVAGQSSSVGGITDGLSNPSSLLSSASGALSSITGLGNTGSLASSFSSLLPPALASTLGTALGALSGNGPSQIKMPTLATNTLDRSGVTSIVGTLLGSKKIPAPQYGTSAAVTNYYDQEIAKLKDRKKQLDALRQAESQAYDEAITAKTQFVDYANNVTDDNNDPGYIAAKANAKAKYEAWEQAQIKTMDFITSS